MVGSTFFDFRKERNENKWYSRMGSMILRFLNTGKEEMKVK